MAAFRLPEWAAQPSRPAALHQEDGPQVVRVDQHPSTLIGRDPAAVAVVLDDARVSRTHAALVHHADGRIYVIDLGSREGVAIDGQRIPPQKPIHLKDGARLTLGPRTWTLRASPAPAPAAAAAAAAPPAGPTHVRASHLLVKHAGSRRPSSWKEASVTRSEADALAMIQAFHKALAAGGAAEFAELARRESHCSSARSGGDLGEFGRGQMQRAFEEAAFGLAVGELSGPVHTDSGVHLIYRTA